MANRWSPKNYLLNQTSISSTGIVSNLPVTGEIPLTAGGALNLVVRIRASGVTVAGAITAKLQTAIGTDWEDSKTVSISGNDDFYIKLLAENSSDQTYLPLLAQARVVVSTTDGGDIFTISSVDVLQAI